MGMWPCAEPEPSDDLAAQVNSAIQEAQDTCDKHRVFCCPECFDMSEAEEGS